MVAANVPGDVPAIVVCPEKRHADGREIKFCGTNVEICFYQERWAANGLCSRESVACIVITRALYEQWMMELLSPAMEIARSRLGAAEIH